MPRHKAVEREQIVSSTRRRLLESAAEEFARCGYSLANINHISETAGFAKGTVYNYFLSKSELMSELIVQITEDHCEFITGQVRQEHDPRRRLERFYQAGFEFVALYPAQARLLGITLERSASRVQGTTIPG